MDPQTQNPSPNPTPPQPQPAAPEMPQPAVPNPAIPPAGPAPTPPPAVPSAPEPSNGIVTGGIVGQSFNTAQKTPAFETISGDKQGMFGRLSLAFGILPILVCLLLIFVNDLIDSLPKTYAWFFTILGLSIAGLVLGILAQRRQEKVSLTALAGIILSIIMCVNCTLVGAYYIKIEMELNKLQSQFDDQDFGPPSSDSDVMFD